MMQFELVVFCDDKLSGAEKQRMLTRIQKFAQSVDGRKWGVSVTAREVDE